MRRAACLALALFACLQAGAAQAISLVQAYEAALANDPEYRAAVHGSEAERENRAIGRSYLLPRLEGSYGRFENRADITAGVRTVHREYDSSAASLSLRQAVINLDALARYRQGKAQARAGEARLEQARQQLIVRVVSAYTEAIFADDQLALGQAQRDMLVEQHKVNERLHQAGEGTVTDVLETQARLDLAEARLLELQDARRAALAMLSSMVGQEVTGLGRLREGFSVRAPDRASFDEWKALALAGNPELRAGALEVEGARQEARRARAGHLPRLDLVASIAKNDSETINTLDQQTDLKSVGFQLTLPLYSGGATSAAVRQARANELRARAELQARSDRLLLDLRREYDAMASSVARINALAKAVESAKLLVRATEKSIAGGVRINLDLLEAQEQLYTAQRDLAEARYRYLLGTLRLRAAAGTLSGEDVRAVAAWFD